MKQLNFLRLLAVLMLAGLMAKNPASAFSYLYIQGDKQTPIYVKLEGGMQPRYGKNYCIIPQMAPGPAHIEILFQQNAYPAQKFTVLMPESGSRGFLLTHQADTWMLYDLQQGFYLPAGNTEAEDRLPQVLAATSNTTQHNGLNIDTGSSQSTRAHEDPYIIADVEKQQKQAQQKVQQEATKAAEPVTTKDDQPNFIKGLELPNPASDTKPTTIDQSETTGSSPTATGIINTDCPSPLSNDEFAKIFNEISGFETDEDRLEFMSKKLGFCYQTWQARTLVNRLEGDAARFELLKKLYPRITDQSAFPLLDDLLSAPVWKAEFDQLIHRK
ncbi:MAG: DUF4476 domain-containing protein [Bacteroidetes bacterium]|nr:DUF4476 domain-containing protein [Bacteroidota bacterium]